MSALASLSVSPIARGTGTPLSISLDEPSKKPTAPQREDGDRVLPLRRPPSARDSLKRREELRKGKEGSRQRRRWENGRNSFPRDMKLRVHLLVMCRG